TTFGVVGVFLHRINLIFIRDITVVSENLFIKYKKRNKNIAVIPNGVDLDRFQPLSKSKSRKLFHLDDKTKYIGYFGSIAKNRGIDKLQESIIELNKTHKDIKLLLAGGINDEKILEDKN